MQRISVSMGKALYEQLRAEAEERDCSISSLARFYIFLGVKGALGKENDA